MKPVWETKMFEIAEAKKISIEEFAKLGNNLYKANYLYKIKSGKRDVPDSLTFQNWAASVLGVPREEIFFESMCTNVREISLSVPN